MKRRVREEKKKAKQIQKLKKQNQTQQKSDQPINAQNPANWNQNGQIQATDKQIGNIRTSKRLRKGQHDLSQDLINYENEESEIFQDEQFITSEEEDDLLLFGDEELSDDPFRDVKQKKGKRDMQRKQKRQRNQAESDFSVNQIYKNEAFNGILLNTGERLDINTDNDIIFSSHSGGAGLNDDEINETSIDAAFKL